MGQNASSQAAGRVEDWQPGMFPWHSIPKHASVGLGQSNVVIAGQVNVGMGEANVVVSRSLTVGMGRVRKAIAFDAVKIGMGSIDELHCLTSTSSDCGIGGVKNRYHHAPHELVAMAMQWAGMQPPPPPQQPPGAAQGWVPPQQGVGPYPPQQAPPPGGYPPQQAAPPGQAMPAQGYQQPGCPPQQQPVVGYPAAQGYPQQHPSAPQGYPPPEPTTRACRAAGCSIRCGAWSCRGRPRSPAL